MPVDTLAGSRPRHIKEIDKTPMGGKMIDKIGAAGELIPAGPGDLEALAETRERRFPKILSG